MRVLRSNKNFKKYEIYIDNRKKIFKNDDNKIKTHINSKRIIKNQLYSYMKLYLLIRGEINKIGSSIFFQNMH